MVENQVTLRTTCRVCGRADLAPILSLGDLYVSDFVTADNGARTFKAPLELVFCSPKTGGCGLLQLKHTVSHEAMYRNYWYRSGINKTMTDALTEIAHSAAALVDLKADDYVIDIGANDGTLLRAYGVPGVNLVGYEPANNLEQYNSQGTTKVFKDFFNATSWKEYYGGKKAKIVTAIAMFYDLDDPNSFVADIAEVLDENGVCVIQQSYLPLMLTTNEIGNICHEHLEYYSLLSLENLLKRHGLEVFDVGINDINGGSFRTYIQHAGKGNTLKIEPGALDRVDVMRVDERKVGLDTAAPYEAFVSRVNGIRDACLKFFAEQKAQGKKIYGYGASTKGNTLLQYFGIGPEHLIAIAERNKDKWGTKTVGSNIPIISEDEARAANPDYFFVLPWHFLKEFQQREGAFLSRGGKFVVPMPNFAVLGL